MEIKQVKEKLDFILLKIQLARLLMQIKNMKVDKAC